MDFVDQPDLFSSHLHELFKVRDRSDVSRRVFSALAPALPSAQTSDGGAESDGSIDIREHNRMLMPASSSVRVSASTAAAAANTAAVVSVAPPAAVPAAVPAYVKLPDRTVHRTHDIGGDRAPVSLRAMAAKVGFTVKPVTFARIATAPPAPLPPPNGAFVTETPRSKSVTQLQPLVRAPRESLPSLMTLGVTGPPTAPRPPTASRPRVSVFAALVRSKAQASNPFAVYAQHAGDGQTKGVTRLKIYFPFASTMEARCDPLHVLVMATATVPECIGLILFRYMSEKRSPPVKPSAKAYVLRVVEDDCEPDMDLPALDANQRMRKFAFDSYCLCLDPSFVDEDDTSKGGGEETSFVRVYFSDDGCTILRPGANATVGDILEQTLKKRALRVGLDYVLESKNDVGRPLDPNTRLSVLQRTDGKALEFKLVRKNSRRRDVDLHTLSRAQLIDLPLHALYQPKTYVVSTDRKYNAAAMAALVELVVDTDKIVVCAAGRASMFGARAARPLQIPMDKIVRCFVVDGARGLLRVVHNSGEPKTLEYCAKSADEAREITLKIATALKARMGEPRALVLQQYEQHVRKT